MKTIGLITNAGRNSGVGLRAYQLVSRMNTSVDVRVVPVLLNGSTNTLEVDGNIVKSISRLPGILGSKSISWVRLAKYIPQFDIYDLSNQSLSFIAKKRRPNIVTVHDIIELTDPQDSHARLLNKYLLSGIAHADRIVSVSEYTKKRIQEYFGIASDTITVIPNGVDEGYTPIENFVSSIAYQQVKQDYKIGERTPIILSVGSEHPRKNMKTILETIAILKKQFPEVLLLKIGDPGILSGREKTLELVDVLHLRSNVKFLGNIPQERLNELYNIADALLFPSYNEGFGLPPLEALAAGCPVFCSNTTSLPEVVGDAAIMHDAQDAQSFADSIIDSIANANMRKTLVQKGIDRAKGFNWKDSAEKMLELYRK